MSERTTNIYNWSNEQLTNFKKMLAKFIFMVEYDENSAYEHGFYKDMSTKIKDGTYKQSGQGYRGDAIQKIIDDCDLYNKAKIFINIGSGYQRRNRGSYLMIGENWIDIYPILDDEKVKVKKLEIFVAINNENVLYDVNTLNLFEDNSLKQYDESKDEKVLIMLNEIYEKYLEYDKNDIIKILKEKKNIILQGAPGTGKTYSVDEIIALMLNKPEWIADHKKLVEECRKENLTIPKSAGIEYTGHIAFCTFHQSMDYEDFIEGIKPEINKDTKSIEYNVEHGIFWHIAEAARNNQNDNYILVIDEINRGNVSKIFGELITLLEAGKRKGGDQEIMVKLPYSKADFSLTNNLYIIGTMNTTDRSVGNLDYAVRRRFSFITMKTDRTVVEKFYVDKDVELRNKALSLFDQINSFIEKHPADDEMDLEDLKIGHSYFMANELELLKLKMKYEVLPLIKEYVKDGLLNIEKDDEAYFKKWKEAEIFDENSRESIELYFNSLNNDGLKKQVLDIYDQMLEVMELGYEVDATVFQKTTLVRIKNSLVNYIDRKVSTECEFKEQYRDNKNLYFTAWKNLEKLYI